MATLTISDVHDAGDDVLAIAATDDAGNTYTAAGWVSATTRHYDADAYYPDGTLEPQLDPATGQPLDETEHPPVDVSAMLRPDAKPRAMTAAEVGDYALSLVLEQNPQLRPAVAPAAVVFEPPAPLTIEAP